MKFVHLYEFFFFIIANHLMFVKNFSNEYSLRCYDDFFFDQILKNP